MKVKIKKLSESAVIPSYSKHGDAGLDLTCISVYEHPCYTEYDTGLSVEIPEGFVGLIFPRSSISTTRFVLANSIGVIDSGYRGSIKCRFKTIDQEFAGYNTGDRIAQLVILPYPEVEFEEVQELSTSVRGVTGFGSSGV